MKAIIDGWATTVVLVIGLTIACAATFWAGSERSRQLDSHRRAAMWLEVVSNVPTAVVVVRDSDGIIAEWNRGAEKMFGITRSDAVGTELTAIGILPEEHIAMHERLFGSGKHPDMVGKVLKTVCIATTPAGDRHVEVTIRAFALPSGPVYAAFIDYYDEVVDID